MLHQRRERRPREKRPKYVVGAGWSSPVARQAHNLKVVGSNPTPATKPKARCVNSLAGFFVRQLLQIVPFAVILRSVNKINAFLHRIIA